MVVRRSRVHSVHLCDQASGAILLPAKKGRRRSRVAYSRFLAERGATRHAERAAVQEVVRADVCGAVVVVLQLGLSGELCCSMPCLDCMNILFRAGIAPAHRLRVVAHDGSRFREVTSDMEGAPCAERRRLMR